MRALRRLREIYNRPQIAPRNVYHFVDPLARVKRLRLWRGRLVNSQGKKVVNKILTSIQRRRPRASMALSRKLLKLTKRSWIGSRLSHFMVSKGRLCKWVGVLNVLKDAIRVRMIA